MRRGGGGGIDKFWITFNSYVKHTYIYRHPRLSTCIVAMVTVAMAIVAMVVPCVRQV